MVVEEDHQLEEYNDELDLINWDSLFDGLPNCDDIFELQPHLTLKNGISSSPDSVSSWIGEIETMLMEDDDNGVDVDPQTNQQACNDFLAEILVDSPSDASGDIVDVSTEKDSSESENCSGGGDGGTSLLPNQEVKEKTTVAHDATEVADSSESENCSGGGDGGTSLLPNQDVKEKTTVDHDATEVADEIDGDDPGSKKRRRQLRNRDAAVRSRERKKMYVRDLELKSKYMEGECRRLDRLLQCFIAENQALRLTLQKGSAFGVTSAKQESAVLLLESLLLGSLLWLLGITCLLILPALPQSVVENAEKKAPGRGAPRRVESKIDRSQWVRSFINSRSCKGSRIKMRAVMGCFGVGRSCRDSPQADQMGVSFGLVL